MQLKQNKITYTYSTLSQGYKWYFTTENNADIEFKWYIYVRKLLEQDVNARSIGWIIVLYLFAVKFPVKYEAI